MTKELETVADLIAWMDEAFKALPLEKRKKILKGLQEEFPDVLKDMEELADEKEQVKKR